MFCKTEFSDADAEAGILISLRLSDTKPSYHFPPTTFLSRAMLPCNFRALSALRRKSEKKTKENLHTIFD